MFSKTFKGAIRGRGSEKTFDKTHLIERSLPLTKWRIPFLVFLSVDFRGKIPEISFLNIRRAVHKNNLFPLISTKKGEQTYDISDR